ncbi:MAG: hypothetical protein QXO84_02520 [Candidatus Aenigmatarchaeota archaeon]
MSLIFKDSKNIARRLNVQSVTRVAKPTRDGVEFLYKNDEKPL